MGPCNVRPRHRSARLRLQQRVSLGGPITRMQPRRLLSILVACAILCGAASARAQYQGNGLKLGESLLLHLGIGAEVGWDSNVFYEANNPTSSFELRLTPRFDLSNRTREQSR